MNSIDVSTAWIIQNSNGMYVNFIFQNATSGSSFTAHPHRAKRFPSQERAQGECCGNEHPVRLLDVLN